MERDGAADSTAQDGFLMENSTKRKKRKEKEEEKKKGKEKEEEKKKERTLRLFLARARRRHLDLCDIRAGSMRVPETQIYPPRS